jgi:hypothetical protein
MTVLWMKRRVVWQKFTDVSEVLAASIIRAIIALMMEASSTCETSVSFCQTTRCNNPEDSHLHARREGKVMFYLTWLSPYLLLLQTVPLS